MLDIAGFTDALTGLSIPATTVTKLINRQLGTVSVSAKVRVVDTNFARLSVIPGAADPSDISQLIQMDGQVVHDTTRPVHRSLHLTMEDPTNDPRFSTLPFPFDPIHNWLAVSQVLSCRGTTLEVPL